MTGLIVNSIPKSGTYLIELILRKWGIQSSGLHFTNDRVWVFAGQPLSEIIANPWQFCHIEPLEQSLDRLQGDAAAVGHLQNPDACLRLFSERGLRTILLVRDLRDCLVSRMRFLSDTRRIRRPQWLEEGGSARDQFTAYLKAEGIAHGAALVRQLDWLDSGVTLLRFEDVVGRNGLGAQRGAVQTLLDVARCELDVDVAVDLAAASLNEETRTFSGSLSSRRDFIGKEADAILSQMGMPAANSRLGYE